MSIPCQQLFHILLLQPSISWLCLAQSIFILSFLPAIYWFLIFFNCHTVATLNLTRLSDSLRILTFVLKWVFFFASIKTQCSAAARQILSFCGGERAAYTEILLMQSRQQVSGQTQSLVFDTEQIIVPLSAVYMCRSQVLVFHYQPGVCSGTSALRPSRRSKQQQQPRGKWCQGRSSPSWWIPDAWTYYFATTSSKKTPKSNRKPPWNSQSPQATVWRHNI